MDPDTNIDAREFFAKFIDDYYADCDEHLRSARRALIELDRITGQGKPDRKLLDELFRNFHTIKGLSGMVSLVPAEKVAHQLEALLGALRDGRIEFSPSVVAGIETGVQQLEQIIAANKSGSPGPDVSETMSKLAALMPAPQSPQPSPTGAQTSTLQPQQPGTDQTQPCESRWLVTYVPSRELAERGLTVDKVRSLLSSLGRILSATPRTEGKGVAFEFTVASAAGADAFAALESNGLKCQVLLTKAEPTQPPPQTTAPPPETATASPPTNPPGPEDHLTRSRPAAQAIIVRVDLARLDNLMRLAGELLTTKGRLSERLKEIEKVVPGPAWYALHEASLTIDRQLRDLREAITRTRLVPVGEAFERMRFVVRDLMRETGKRVKVEISGQHTEIDKLVVEKMMEPLLHLVRNAVSHGIESPEERAAAGKAAEGKLRLSAATAGDTVVIEIEDDGHGIRIDKVTARARAMGLIDNKTNVDESSLLSILCAPGFSTREEADMAAGRGVGMNVVLNTVRELGGRLSLHTESGRGTRFTIELPITLLITDVLIVTVAGQTLAIPQASVREVIKTDLSSIMSLQESELLPHRDTLIPLLRLSRLFGWHAPETDSVHILIVASGGVTVGLIADRILGQREIVVHSLADPLVCVPGVAGATQLGDGRAILILDVAELVRTQQEHASNRTTDSLCTVPTNFDNQKQA